MRDGPNIAAIAAMVGDPARANMLTALLNGAALTASELALEAGVSKQTASSHLGKLVDGGLVAVEAQGRHRYYRLANADVAGLLETLMGVAARAKALRARPGPKEPALRRARPSAKLESEEGSTSRSSSSALRNAAPLPSSARATSVAPRWPRRTSSVARSLLERGPGPRVR